MPVSCSHSFEINTFEHSIIHILIALENNVLNDLLETESLARDVFKRLITLRHFYELLTYMLAYLNKVLHYERSSFKLSINVFFIFFSKVRALLKTIYPFTLFSTGLVLLLLLLLLLLWSR
jgi:hypothetical protein